MNSKRIDQRLRAPMKSTSFLTVLVAALVATGCGGKAESKDKETTPVATAVAAAPASAASAGERIRKALKERLPNSPEVDDVTATPVPGVYEVRLGTEIMYSDADVNYVFQGSLIDARERVNLTEARIEKLTAIDFNKLPLKDAVVYSYGKGERKVAVFADPNCGYCKRLEADMRKVDNVTVYTFLVPVLGQDSANKSRNIWCAKDRSNAWLSWMLNGQTPAQASAKCETPIDRNMALAQKHRVNGTPALVFSDSTRVPGAIGAEAIEERLQAAAAKTAAK